jgi:hypothetical protein
MRNSYLRIKTTHPVVIGLEDAYKIINSVYRVRVKPNISFPSPVTLIPTYPDLPMEDVYPRQEETDTRELYLSEPGHAPNTASPGPNPAKGRVAYIPGDLDRSFWQMLNTDHSRLLRNTILWALNEAPTVTLQTKGIIDVSVWAQQKSMTVHLVNLTNPMYMKGPFREILPVDAGVRINIPGGRQLAGVRLLMSDTSPAVRHEGQAISLDVKGIEDHEIIALDFV